jgi:hypothetical protein
MKDSLLIILLFCCINLSAQFGSCIEYAVIKDSDGYTNVRKEPAQNSEIIHILKKNVVFELFDTATTGWIKIRLINNRFGVGDINQAINSQYGYVHSSRILVLNKLKKYKGNDIQFSITNEPFNSIGRVITRSNGAKWLTHIDGRPTLGTDGDMPKTQIKTINLSVKGKIIPIHEIFQNDLFECDNHFEFKKVGNTFFAYQANSDGAGFYEVLWVFDSEKLLQRIISIYPC